MEKRRLWLLGGVAALVLGSVGCDASRAEAEGAAKDWAVQHADGWELEVSSSSQQQAFVAGPSNEPCTNGSFWLRAETGPVDVNLFFSCAVPGVVDLDWIRSNLLGYGLSGLHPPIDAGGWSFEIYPDGNHGLLSDVTIESWERGQLSLRIVASLSRILGESDADVCVAERMGADGGLEDCWVDVDYEGPLELSLSVPLAPTTFQAAVPTRF
jgi:hypothetical protein